ncbi:hypothetical protein FPCIR_2054 [Fusarium pseudocircinatum]|uniref:Uncharacterized protein n=1 Tax=Fusarium pseudocircinatum TaxID=56676 RepID=A0A8H5PTU0_9HYPO|nr:hypothetical protein FPCIR_2054 [Fusarium pseudocircinatum]
MNNTNVQALARPNDRWSICQATDQEGIGLYNILVQQWNDWAKEDAAEKEENWLDLAFRLKNRPAHRRAGFARSVESKAQNQGGGRATVCWGHCILASWFYRDLRTDFQRQLNPTLNQLQQWYPRSDILGNIRYNEDGPSFPTINGGDPIPVRGNPGQEPEQDSGPQA